MEAPPVIRETQAARRRNRKHFLLLTVVCVIGVLVFAGFGSWVTYEMFIEGTTQGPDFIRAIQSGKVTPDTISSIEVVEPEVGYTASSAKELASLERRAEIHSPVTISHLFGLMRTAQAGWEPRNMNHPGTTHETYLKINTKDGFFWLYCSVLEDANGAFFSIQANTRNATNPNGARSYYLGNFAQVLQILEYGKSTEPDGGTNGSQPFSSETNRTLSAAGSRR
jgi:hypothetical protein